MGNPVQAGTDNFQDRAAQEQPCLNVPQADRSGTLSRQQPAVRAERDPPRAVLPPATRIVRVGDEELPAPRPLQVIPNDNSSVVVRGGQCRAIVAEGKRNGTAVEVEHPQLLWVRPVGDVPDDD